MIRLSKWSSDYLKSTLNLNTNQIFRVKYIIKMDMRLAFALDSLRLTWFRFWKKHSCENIHAWSSLALTYIHVYFLWPSPPYYVVTKGKQASYNNKKYVTPFLIELLSFIILYIWNWLMIWCFTIDRLQLQVLFNYRFIWSLCRDYLVFFYHCIGC